MKKIIFSTMFLVTAFMGSLAAMAAGNNGGDWIKVFYYDFRIDRIVGINESDIGDLGCQYRISRHQFGSMLVDGGAKYDPHNVKAIVVVSPDEKYFIDYAGSVRSGEHHYAIDRDKFVSALVADGACEIKCKSSGCARVTR